VKRIIIMGILLAAGTSWAAGSGDAASGWDAWKMVVYQAINLVVLLAIIVKFAGPTVRNALKGRAERVTQDIDEAAALHAEAKKMLDEYSEKLSGFEAQRNELLAEFQAMGEAERDRIITGAHAEAERIQNEAARVAENESNRAKERLESEIVDLAIEQAEQIIQSKLSEDDHTRLVTEYFGQLESSVRAQ
jgi:F-type H+-transporting ATPase subunit b